MPVVKKCCFCLSLPAGGITLGWLTIISGVLSIASSIFGLINLDKTFRAVAENLDLDVNNQEYDMIRTLYKSSIIAYLAITVFVTLSAILLIVGASKRKAGLILPWLIGSMVSIVCNGFFLLAMLTSQQTAIPAVVSFGAVLGIQIYLWVCMYALYQLIVEQRNRQPRGQNQKGGKRLYPSAMA